MALALRASLRMGIARQACLPVSAPARWISPLACRGRNFSSSADKEDPAHGGLQVTVKHKGIRGSVPLTPRRSSRAFASGSGGKDKEEFFPDSWVEPEALWDYAQGHQDDEDMHIDDIFASDFGARNAEFRKEKMAADPDYFKKLGAGQAPKYLWIGCSDSRVSPENLVIADPGEIFVHRNIANQVVSTDTNLRSVLHYAVDYLKVEHIIVCGHYECGGVRAACTDNDHASPLESWLTNIRDVYRLHQAELEAIISDEERHKRMVELNVIEQCLNIYKTGDVQRKRSESIAKGQKNAFPRIHGMVFDPNDGILRRLPIDFKDYLRKYQKVYNMYDPASMMSSYETPN